MVGRFAQREVAPILGFESIGPVSCRVCGCEDVLVVRRQRALVRDLDEVGTDGRKLMHSSPTDVYRCDACHSLFRHPAAVPVDVARSYRDDVYGEEELARLHRNECALATAREPWFRAHGLETDARILEVGSYAGGLLALARAHGCRAVGVDVAWRWASSPAIADSR